MIPHLLAALLLTSPVIVHSVRRDNPVILDTFRVSDWAVNYNIDLPAPGVYNLSFSCGMDETAVVNGLEGPGRIKVQIVTVLPKTQECFINFYTRGAPVVDGGTDAGLDAGTDQ